MASFNKGASGGGYGPVVTAGQLLSGVDGKNAIGITSLAEGLTSAVGVAIYFFVASNVDWALAPYLAIGALLSVPLSAFTVKKIKTKRLRVLVGIVTLVIGFITFGKLLIY